jgi:hypothetical protein
MTASHSSAQPLTVLREVPADAAPSLAILAARAFSFCRAAFSVLPLTVSRRTVPPAVQPARMLPIHRPSLARW